MVVLYLWILLVSVTLSSKTETYSRISLMIYRALDHYLNGMFDKYNAFDLSDDIQEDISDLIRTIPWSEIETDVNALADEAASNRIDSGWHRSQAPRRNILQRLKERPHDLHHFTFYSYIAMGLSLQLDQSMDIRSS